MGGNFEAHAIIPSTNDQVQTTCRMIKAPEEHQMESTIHSLVDGAPKKPKAPANVLLPIENSIEMLSFAT